MIDRVNIRNFKCLQDVTLELGRFTVLVGPNGCGKSSVLQALLYAFHTQEGEAPGWRELAGAPSDAAPLAVMAHGDGYTLSWRIDFAAEPPADPSPAKVKSVWVLSGPDGSTEALPGAWQQQPEARRTFSTVLLHPEAEKLCRPARTDTGARLGLRPDGEGLATLLSYIAGYDADAFAAISRDLGVVVPGAKRVRVHPAEVESVELLVHVLDGHEVKRSVTRKAPGHQFLVEFADGRKVRSELISEGTAVALAILTVLHLPTRPNLVLLDDIDRGLHIEAQARLVQILRDLLHNHPDLQIVCTTHSPYLLDRFDPSEVRVLALDEGRNTHARKLSEHPELEQWKIGVQTGELWAALGDAWVAAREPQP